ncbi:MAG: DUF4124 domain-containing protein [Methylococcales bacterium]|nr:DUF4124 domain-containing protein [Methylococcales bacterium]
MIYRIVILSLGVSASAHAQVYKCVNPQTGRVLYQSSPCKTDEQALIVDIDTGTVQEQPRYTDPELQRLEQAQQQEQRAEQQRAEKARLLQRIKTENEQNERLLRSRPQSFSAQAIRAYDYDRLDEWLKPFQSRLPEIERMKRLAALKVLDAGSCQRVESTELSRTSRIDNLVFTVSCSNQPETLIMEQELNQ